MTDGMPQVAKQRADKLIQALQVEAPEGRVVAGWFQVVLISKANDIDEAAKRHLPKQRD